MHCKRQSFLIQVVVLALGISCGGGSSSGSTLSVTPGSLVIAGTDTATFSANKASVTWSVVQGNEGGTISAAGKYVAPNRSGQFQVKAVAPDGSTGSASVTVAFTTSYSNMLSRSGHTATVLADGSVLVVGGWYENRDNSTSSALYSPAADNANDTGSLIEGREYHTATLLQDGRVWVAGGKGEWSIGLKTSETYDPKTGRFSPGPALSKARTSHRATRLKDGRVLITGGYSSSTTDGVPINTAEIFDPSTGSVSVIPATPTVGKGNHQAILLQDGRVLLSSGKALEVFDPATFGFTVLPATLPGSRSGHSLALLQDGQVLLVGGSDEQNQPVARVDRFNPANGSIVTAGQLNRPRIGQSANLMTTGHVVIAGGSYYDNVNRNISLVEYYDPQSASVKPLGDTFYGRYGQVGVLLQDGRVFLLGGAGNPKGVVGGGAILSEFIHRF